MEKDNTIPTVSGGDDAAAPEGHARDAATRRVTVPAADQTTIVNASSLSGKKKIIQVRRVTKVVKGGKKLSFRAVVAVGNGKGRVGVGVGKAAEVISAIQKGVVDARKSLVKVPLVGTSIPHQITGKQGSSRILLKPAAKGTGVIAGGAARAILKLAGVGDVLSKSLGSRAPLNVARATIDGLSELRTFEEAARLRGISIRQMFA